MFLAPYYYVLDLALTFYEMNIFKGCRFAFFTHHIVCTLPLFFICRLNYIPWWVILFAGTFDYYNNNTNKLIKFLSHHSFFKIKKFNNFFFSFFKFYQFY